MFKHPTHKIAAAIIGGTLLLLFIIMLFASDAEGASNQTPCAALTGATSHVIIPADVASTAGLAPDATVRYETEGALCVGETTVATNGPTLVTLWGDDIQTTPLDGALEGAPIIMQTAAGPMLANYVANPAPYAGTSSAYQTDLIYQVESLQGMANTIGFRNGPHTVQPGGNVAVPIRAEVQGTAIGALQFDLTVPSGITVTNVASSGAMSSFTIVENQDGNTTRVLAYDGSLTPGTYNSLFTVTYAVTAPGTVEFGNVIGALDVPEGTDAGFSISKGQVTFGQQAPYGDANGNGTFGLTDLTSTVTHAVSIEVEPLNTNMDVHPFPAGNGTIDVRDVQVMARALGTTVWPDGTPISTTVGNKQTPKGNGGNARVGTVTIYSDTQFAEAFGDVNFKALLVDFSAEEIQLVEPPLGVTMTLDDLGNGTHRVLAYRLDPEPLPNPIGLVTGQGITFVGGEAVLMDDTSIELVGGISTDAASSAPIEDFDLKAYPNPVVNQINVQVDYPEAGKATVEIFDILGRRVAQLNEGEVAAGRHTFKMDTAELPAGAYFVRVQGIKTQTARITVVK